MKSGIERAPVYPSPPEGVSDLALQQSFAAYDVLSTLDRWAEGYIGVGADEPFKITDDVLEMRKQQLEKARDESYVQSRGVHQIGNLVTATVAQMETEFERSRVIDIGCGEGRLGTELARKAKARVTFVDNDGDALAKVARKAGTRLLADATNLPFSDESFDKAVSAFSSVIWAPSPKESLKSLHEAIRVTEVGGSTFITPLIVNPNGRRFQKTDHEVAGLLGKPAADNLEAPETLKLWAVQDHILLNSLRELADTNYCDVTWGSFIANGQNTGATLELYSVIVDKNKSIPAEVFDEQMAYADQFMDISA